MKKEKKSHLQFLFSYDVFKTKWNKQFITIKHLSYSFNKYKSVAKMAKKERTMIKNNAKSKWIYLKKMF